MNMKSTLVAAAVLAGLPMPTWAAAPFAVLVCTVPQPCEVIGVYHAPERREVAMTCKNGTVNAFQHIAIYVVPSGAPRIAAVSVSVSGLRPANCYVMIP